MLTKFRDPFGVVGLASVSNRANEELAKRRRNDSLEAFLNPGTFWSSWDSFYDSLSDVFSDEVLSTTKTEYKTVKVNSETGLTTVTVHTLGYEEKDTKVSYDQAKKELVVECENTDIGKYRATVRLPANIDEATLKASSKAGILMVTAEAVKPSEVKPSIIPVSFLK